MSAASSAVIVSNWLAFLSLTFSFIGLLIFSLKYKGPTGKEAYYNGFREQNMLGVFINLFCAVAYFAKIIAAHTDGVGFQPFTTMKYVDYMTTCPLLTIDMLWQLEAPYKASCAALVLVCLTFAVAVDSTPPPANFVWFGTGLAFFTFSYTMILTIVRGRLDFFISCARDSHAKKSIGYLKIALFSYFGIWVFFPVLWILGEKGMKIVSNDVSHVFHAILDVIAKSCYGYALLYFKVFFDKKLIASGVDEEEFSKFSKDVTTHKDEDDDGPRRRKDRSMDHSPIRVRSREDSPVSGIAGTRRASLQDDNYTLFGRVMASNDRPKARKKDDASFELADKMRGHRTSFSTRSRNGDGKLRSQYNDAEGEHDLEMGARNMPPLDEPHDSSDDEAAFVERARQQYQMKKSRSMGRPNGV